MTTSRVAELYVSHDEAMRRMYAAMGAPCFIHSFVQHEVSYQSQAVPGVSVTIDVLLPHYTDRYDGPPLRVQPTLPQRQLRKVRRHEA